MTHFISTFSVLACLCLTASAQGGSSELPFSARFQKSDGPIQLDATVSSEVSTEMNLDSKFECLTKCLLKVCAVAVFVETSRACQLVTVNNASLALGPPGTHVQRLLGSEAGATVWKAVDLDDILRTRSFAQSSASTNSVRIFNNTGTGSTGSIQQTVINITGCYRIEVAGAAGGDNAFQGKSGGTGSFASGSFNLTAGTQLAFVVGQMGSSADTQYSGAGGGGGSFVYRTSNGQLLIAAGGGGGASHGKAGQAGNATTSGGNSIGNNAVYMGFGGTNGQPGSNTPSNTQGGSNHGGCGAGWLGKPVNSRRSNVDGDRGGGLADDWVGGKSGIGSTGVGGFGGGGGGGDPPGASNFGAPGAGGGFSGGGAGTGGSHSAGGGGSFCSGSGCNATTGGNAGSDHGFVVLRLLVPFVDTCE